MWPPHTEATPSPGAALFFHGTCLAPASLSAYDFLNLTVSNKTLLFSWEPASRPRASKTLHALCLSSLLHTQLVLLVDPDPPFAEFTCNLTTLHIALQAATAGQLVLAQVMIPICHTSVTTQHLFKCFPFLVVALPGQFVLNNDQLQLSGLSLCLSPYFPKPELGTAYRSPARGART